MENTLEEKFELIKKSVLLSNLKNPIKMAKGIMKQNFVNMHGPEHHFLDGACILASYKNAGGEIDLNTALDKLAKRAIKMPVGMCGMWGVCGAVSSVGASISIINNTNSASENEGYKENMLYTSLASKKMSEIGSPRCCKRHAYIALETAIDFVKEYYKVELEKEEIACDFYDKNPQCIKERCPYYKKKKD